MGKFGRNNNIESILNKKPSNELLEDILKEIAENITSISIPNDFIGIISYSDFKDRYRGKKSEFCNGSYKKIDVFLRKLCGIVGMDPIEYLYYLYYEEKLSTIVIYDLLYWIGGYNNKKKDRFEKMFVNTFGWKLRSNTDITDLGKEKIIKSNLNILSKQKEKKFKKEEELYELLNLVYRKRGNKNIDLLPIQGNVLQKLNIFLNRAGYTKTNIRLRKYLTYLKRYYSFSVIVDVINKILTEHNAEFRINKGRLSELLNGKYEL